MTRCLVVLVASSGTLLFQFVISKTYLVSRMHLETPCLPKTSSLVVIDCLPALVGVATQDLCGATSSAGERKRRVWPDAAQAGAGQQACGARGAAGA